MKFDAAVLVQTQRPLEIVTSIQVPKLSYGQVLVKILYAGVCQSQLMEQQGLRGPDQYLPHMLGHEATGLVVDFGEGVSKVKIGDKVVLGWLKGEGLDVKGAAYDTKIGRVNSGPITTFSEYSIVSENRCYMLPANINELEGVLLGCALPTGMGIVKNQIAPTEHSILGIMGLGGIGMSALIAAANLPHKKIIAIDVNPEKLVIARKLGADLCLNPSDLVLAQNIAAATDGHMLDYVVESAGKASTIELAFSLINSKSGHCIFASHPAIEERISLNPFELICGKRITGSWGGESDPEDVCQFVSNQKSKMDFSAFLSSRYKLGEINQAMNDLNNQKVLRAILEI